MDIYPPHKESARDETQQQLNSKNSTTQENKKLVRITECQIQFTGKVCGKCNMDYCIVTNSGLIPRFK